MRGFGRFSCGTAGDGSEAPLPGGTSAARVKEDPTSRSWQDWSSELGLGAGQLGEWQDQRLVGRWLYGVSGLEKLPRGRDNASGGYRL